MAATTRWPKVAIVLVSWNQADLTLACLESLRRLDYPAFEVVIADNGSHDGAPARIRERFPEHRLLENGRNLGFTGGCNVGIRYALEHGTDYVLLLNTDTEVAPDFLSRLVEVGESDPSIGILGPKIYYYEPSNVIWSAGGAIDARGEPRHLGEGKMDEWPADRQEGPSRDVAYVTGCALLAKRAVIDRVGALDDRFFAYFEETEWCARARRAGFRVVYVPGSHVWHKISMAARHTSRLYLYLMTRNRLLYLRTSGAPPAAIGWAMVDMLRTLGSWTLRPRHRAMRPYATAVLRGMAHFLLGRFGSPPSRP